jgi:hypothetical protein
MESCLLQRKQGEAGVNGKDAYGLQGLVRRLVEQAANDTSSSLPEPSDDAHGVLLDMVARLLEDGFLQELTKHVELSP